LAAGTECALGWRDDALDFRIEVGEDGMARITRLTTPGILAEAHGDATLPLLDVVLAGEGKAWSGGRYCESEAGRRFRYTGHDRTSAEPPWCELRVDLADPVSGLRAEVFFSVLTGHGALRSWVRLTNHGRLPVTVESVSSFLYGGLSSDGGPDDIGDLDVLWAENDWLAEARWQRRELRDALPDLNRRVHGADPRGRFSLTSIGSWSSGTYLPMGAVVSRRTGHAWAWQIEHNGAWHWQVGECTRRLADGPAGRHAPRGSVTGAYIALLGPAEAEHHWRVTLASGEAFTTVPAAVVVSEDGLDGAVACLTACRRAIRRPHADHRNLPVVFNDYMNTLVGSPTTKRLLPLIAAAGQAGAEYFCIDAGWYAEIDQNWWDTVGSWKPSASRFPNGITEVLDHIRTAGMVPGLWLEPEVVGVNSPVVRQLPPEALLCSGGRPVVENGRYHLDLRHPAAVKHLNEAVDYVVGDLGVGYLKLDYNIAVCPGPDTGNVSPGAGLLAVNRAYLDWLDDVLDRYPDLVLENCSSGGMRMDYALLARLQIQSTSDQQDYLRYPPVAAAAPTAMTPEQAGVWAYPQPSFTDEEITFTLCGALLGRVCLSGHLDQMNPGQRELVAAAVRTHKSVRPDLAAAVPFWPLGLPRWTDSWIALGMRAPRTSYLTVWHRGACRSVDADPAELTLPVPHLRGQSAAAKVLYPSASLAGIDWDAAHGTLAVSLPRTPAACLVALAH
jgi:alpha-galactosidase